MQERKKIAILCDFPVWLVNSDYPVKNGHYAVWLMPLFEFFKNVQGYEIHWVCTGKQKKIGEFECGNQFFHVVPRSSKLIGVRTWYCWDRWRIGRVLRKIQPDLLHAWGTEYCYGLVCKDFKGKKLLSVQGALTAYAQRANIAKFEQMQSKYEPEVFRNVPHMTTESEWARERVLEIAPSANVELWEYAAEQRFFDVEREPDAKPCCLLAGTNAPVKDVPTAIAAFSRPELQHVTLYMAGVREGAYENLPPNIVPLGRIGRDEIAQMMRRVWGLVHTSLADTGPTIVKEARVVGLPVVLTTDNGAKQYVVQGKSGFIIEPKDVDALVNGVLCMTKDLETSKRMGAYDRERCREALSAQTMTEGIMSLYQRILAE